MTGKLPQTVAGSLIVNEPVVGMTEIKTFNAAKIFGESSGKLSSVSH
jgi:ABC-type uncharacterized transport system ATPase subunit